MVRKLHIEWAKRDRDKIITSSMSARTTDAIITSTMNVRTKFKYNNKCNYTNCMINNTNVYDTVLHSVPSKKVSSTVFTPLLLFV